jgi:hypothetical protein
MHLGCTTKKQKLKLENAVQRFESERVDATKSNSAQARPGVVSFERINGTASNVTALSNVLKLESNIIDRSFAGRIQRKLLSCKFPSSLNVNQKVDSFRFGTWKVSTERVDNPDRTASAAIRLINWPPVYSPIST